MCPGAPYVKNLPGRVRTSRAAMKGEPIWLRVEQATLAARDFSETAKYRGWGLLAGSVMTNHVHLVVGVQGDPPPEKLLQIFKSYASRALNRAFGRPVSGTWWTESGSKRKLNGDQAVTSAVRYVVNQAHCLAKCEIVAIGKPPE
jgi:REP element-mobilizing transposase RayT